MSGEITDFEVQGKRRLQIVVSLDGEAWATLDPETVVKENLRRGQKLNAAARAGVLATDEAIRARKAAAGYCARGARTRIEMEHYLRRRGFGGDAAAAAIAALEASGTLNDVQTADATIRKRRRSGHGPRRIEAELLARGIAPRQASARLAEALEGADVRQECEAQARRAAGRYAPLGDPAQRRKLMQYLLRRGYAGEMAAAAVRKVAGAASTPDEDEIIESET